MSSGNTPKKHNFRLQSINIFNRLHFPSKAAPPRKKLLTLQLVYTTNHNTKLPTTTTQTGKLFWPLNLPVLLCDGLFQTGHSTVRRLCERQTWLHLGKQFFLLLHKILLRFHLMQRTPDSPCECPGSGAPQYAGFPLSTTVCRINFADP